MSDGNYRPDLKGLRLFDSFFRLPRKSEDGNYRPDLKGLRQHTAVLSRLVRRHDGNYRPDLKGLRLLSNKEAKSGVTTAMEITDLI